MIRGILLLLRHFIIRVHFMITGEFRDKGAFHDC